MIWISSEQLFVKLQEELKPIYILFGNDSCSLQENHLGILKIAKTLNFNENTNIEIDIYSDWNKIFNLCKMQSLFTKQKILSLKFPQNYPIDFFNKNIPLLSLILHENIILILCIYESNQIKKNNIFRLLRSFNTKGVFVNCIRPEHTQLRTWIINQAKDMKIFIEDLACQLLCYYYEGNLILLKQILQNLSLIYPDGNLNFIRVRKVVDDSAYFNVNHWIEAILIGNKKRADRILNQLENIGIDLEILLRRIQHEILIVINIKYSFIYKKTLFFLFKQHKIDKKYYRVLLCRAAERLQLSQIYQAIELLTQIELRYKTNYLYLSRSDFELLTAILCYNTKD